MNALCCGLDIGTTNLKAVLVDDAGRVHWARAVPAVRDADGGTDGPALLRAAEDLMIEGWREVGNGVPIRAVATAGVGEDGMALGPGLEPYAPAIPWFDERALAEAEELGASPARSPRLGLAPDRFRTIAKWLWLARHRPEETGEGRVWITLTDYPAVIWSGRPFTSASLATRTAAYDVYRREWHAPMLEAAHAPALPAVVPAGTVIGSLLPGRLSAAGVTDESTLVVAGGHDHPIAASFIRRFQPDAVVDSMGTAEVVYAEIADTRVRDLDPRIATSVPVLGGPGLACLGVFEIGLALHAFRHGPHGDLVTAFLGGESVPDADVGLPLDASALMEDGTMSALSRGEALRMTVHAIEKAILTGRAMIDAIGARGDIYATGGWSRSDRFLSMRARLFGRTVVRFDEEELTGAGAGLIAWSALRSLDPTRLERPGVTRFEPPSGAVGADRMAMNRA